jgi:hypothetical protein
VLFAKTPTDVQLYCRRELSVVTASWLASTKALVRSAEPLKGKRSAACWAGPSNMIKIHLRQMPCCVDP